MAIHSIFKENVYSAISILGLPHRMHRLLNKNRITILMYHGIVDALPPVFDWCLVTQSNFEFQIQYIKKHFNVISLSDALSLLDSGDIKKPTAVITFDDGYQNNFDYAYPILSKEKVPATIFITTSLIDSNKTIWTGYLHTIFMMTTKDNFNWGGENYAISDNKEKHHVISKIKSKLKRTSHTNQVAAVEEISRILVGQTNIPISNKSPYRMLDRTSIKEMLKSGLIEFGDHTLSHPILSQMSYLEQQREILDSIKELENITNRKCRFFAYPNGSKQDYNTDSINILRKRNIECALTTTHGTCAPETPRLELQRIGIGGDISKSKFKLLVHNMTF